MQFKLWTDANKTQPADLTNVIAKAQIRDKSGGTKITDLDCSVQLPNIILLDLLTEQWLTMVSSKGMWDMQLTYPSGDVSTIVAGTVTVTSDVTA